MITRSKIYTDRCPIHLFIEKEYLSELDKKAFSLNCNRTELINDYIIQGLKKSNPLSKVHNLERELRRLRKRNARPECISAFSQWFKDNYLEKIKNDIVRCIKDIHVPHIPYKFKSKRDLIIPEIIEDYICFYPEILSLREQREIEHWLNYLLIKMSMRAEKSDAFKSKIAKINQMEKLGEIEQKRLRNNLEENKCRLKLS